jgi:precorrin-3B synthase
LAVFRKKLGFALDRDVKDWRRPASDARLRFGVHRQGTSDRVCVGAQVPLGRLDAATLSALADLAPRLRMTPWQSVMLLDVPFADAQAVVERLAALGLATNPDEPFRAPDRVHRLTRLRKKFRRYQGRRATSRPVDAAHGRRTHLSGCARSCAAAHRVETTLIAVAPGRYDSYGEAPEALAHHLTIEQAARWLARSSL